MNILVPYQLVDQSCDINTAGVCSTTSSTAPQVIECYLMKRCCEDVDQDILSLAEADDIRTLQ